MSLVQDKQIRFNAWNAILNLTVTVGRSTFTTLQPDGLLGPSTEAAFAAMTAAKPTWLTDTPDPALCAVDSLSPIDSDLLSVVCRSLRAPPVWWGRYISVLGRPDACGVSGAEGTALASVGTPLQPISANAARLGLLGGDLATGLREGTRDVRLLQEVTQNVSKCTRRVFLDVEEKSVLNCAFYIGWSKAVAAAGWEPAVYMPNRLFPAQWKELHAALAAGATCAGTWSAWYPFQTEQELDLGTSEYMAVAWDPQFARNDDNLDCAWQYMGALCGDRFDATAFKPGVTPWW